MKPGDWRRWSLPIRYLSIIESVSIDYAIRRRRSRAINKYERTRPQESAVGKYGGSPRATAGELNMRGCREVGRAGGGGRRGEAVTSVDALRRGDASTWVGALRRGDGKPILAKVRTNNIGPSS